ncbi:hypothetical protein [Sphingobacterium prati]|uniref:hypothetical protein n=1 Tax=Sphingobacterium prati TaxID=2737006 RepID=UPI0015578073|nr:hypothetical protein [Sphingobacterium prati]NPE48462.1 hypothetical protein [Sphingobacterium prati]
MTDLDKILLDVHEEMYDPIKHIVDFWNKYDIRTCHEYFVALCAACMGNPLNKEPRFDADQMLDFVVKLMRMHIGYHMAHYKNLEFGNETILTIETSIITAEELRVGEKIYQFFNRQSENH